MSKENEKKLMADKVAKVREVVQGVNNNDIIMVLHSFDLNVEKTIQAFCEDGASGILGAWVRPGAGGAAKNKNKKKKKTAAAVSEGVIATTPSTAASLQNDPVSENNVPVHRVEPVVSKPKPLNATLTGSPAKSPAINGVITNGTADNNIAQAFKTLRVAINNREKELQANPQADVSLDTAELLKVIASFGKGLPNGKPVHQTAKVAAPKAESPPPAPAAPIKHATSQSSITSSVGADSGVNLSPTHKEEKKPVAKPQTLVSSGAIKMSSDGLSEEQLAALSNSLSKCLSAQGIDASLLTSTEAVARRPRNKKPEVKKGRKETRPQPDLSIL